MLKKEFNVKYKDEGTGTLEGYASTWVRVPDSVGDVVKAGAFKNSLATRWNGGKGIPLIWAHKMDDLSAYIGKADADEDETGLHFIATFDDTEEAQRVRELYKDGRLKKFSFAYDVLDQSSITLENGTKANELRELDIHEISCVCVSANDTAEVIDVKAGRRNSKSDEDKIKQAITLLQSVVDTEEEPEGEDEPKANEASEEPKASNPKKEQLLTCIKKMEEK